MTTESLFDAHPDPVVTYQPADPPIVTALNPAFEQAFGNTTDLLDQPLAETLDEIGVRVDDQWPAVATDSTSIHPDAETTAVDGHVYTLRTIEGHEARHLLLTDVSSYVDQRERLEAENSRLERFASIVSHDLRNPLQVAQSRLAAAKETGDEIHFAKAAAAHTRMQELIEDVLTLAKSGATISETESVDIAECAREAWASVDADEATFTVDDLGTVEADPERLRTVFENLFRNSIEHGCRDVAISVESADNGFAVVDTGPGIPVDRRDEVFKAGVSTGDGTTGLGLSIVSEIAAAHGWDVSLTESSAGGAKFTFRT